MGQQAMVPGILFHSLQRAHRNALQAELAASGLGDLGSPLMLFILKQGEKTGVIPAQKELARTLRVSPSAVAVSLKSLERSGYVKKHSDPTDQRCKRITLTTKGAGAANLCLQAFEQVECRMFDGFTPEECQQLNDYHLKMLHNLRGSDFPEIKFPFERTDYPCSKN